MASGTVATSQWVEFFSAAGIPPGPALSYALSFVANRVQRSMLQDLSKELLNELGITLVGDVIAVLRHARAVHCQELCQAASELLCPSPAAPQAELRRAAPSAASRMIANSLSREAPPPGAGSSQSRPSASQISITVPNATAAGTAGLPGAGAVPGPVPAKRRRGPAAREGSEDPEPGGSAARGRRILQEQLPKGLQRPSVFERLGAEAWPEAAEPGKPRGVFSRLGSSSVPEEDPGALPYAGVLKAPSQLRSTPGASAAKASPGPGPGGTPAAAAAAAQDGAVSSSQRRLRVTIRRDRGCGAVSSSSDLPGARMDAAADGALSVFRRLGRKRR